MAYIGKSPTAAPLTSSDVADGIISTAKIADNAVTSAKTVYEDISFRNVIINGDMVVAQRGASSTGIGASAGYFTLDRWNISTASSAGRLTMTQTADGPSGIANCLKLACTTADTSIDAAETLIVRQKIEDQNCVKFKKGTADAEQISVSFYAKQNESRVISVGLYDSQNNRIIMNLVTVGTSWARHEITFAADTTGAFADDTGIGFELWFFLHAGSNYTSGTLATSWESYTAANTAVGIGSLYASTSNTFFLTGVQVEAGDTVSDFEFLPYDVNLARCQRYYQSSFEKGVTPGNNEANYLMQDCSCYADNNLYFGTPLFCEMRADPTCVYYTGNNGSSAGNKFTYIAESGWTSGTAANAVLTDKYISAHGSITGSHNDSILLQYNYTFDSEL